MRLRWPQHEVRPPYIYARDQRTQAGQPPGGRYVVSFAMAASISAGVSSATVRTVAPPPALTVRAAAAAVTLSGKSPVAYTSVAPKAK